MPSMLLGGRNEAMQKCSRCSETSTEFDEKGRCAICQYELKQEKDWRDRNIDKIRAGNKVASRKHYAANREKILERNRQTYWDNRDEKLAAMRSRRLKNRDAVNAKKRAKYKQQMESMTVEEKAALREYQRAGYARRQKERLGLANMC